MRKVFLKRAKIKSILAYILLVISLIIIVVGIILAFYITAKFSLELAQHSLSDVPKDQQEITKTIIDNIKYKYTAFLVTLLSMLFFISQILLRLYRYNILKADFYIACADSLILTQKFGTEQKTNFETLLTTLISEKISLSTPKSPTFSIFSSKEK